MIMMPDGCPRSSLQLTGQADFWHPTGANQSGPGVRVVLRVASAPSRNRAAGESPRPRRVWPKADSLRAPAEADAS
jgi:hypothetical protein